MFAVLRVVVQDGLVAEVEATFDGTILRIFWSALG